MSEARSIAAAPVHVTKVRDTVWQLDPEYRELAARSSEARQDLTARLNSLQSGFSAAEPSAFDEAFAFLELDVYLFRSGYERAHMVRSMAMSVAAMSGEQEGRARGYVLACVDGRLHCDQRALTMLGSHVNNNQLRRELLVRLHSSNPSVVSRQRARSRFAAGL